MKNKIDTIQFSAIFIILLVTNFFGIGIYSIVKSSGVDAWISIIFASIFSLIISFITISIFKYKPNLNLKQKINHLFNPFISKIINIILSLIIFIYSIIVFYNLNTFISSQYLANTPELIIGSLFLILIIFINIKGLETISRTSFIVIIINATLLITAILSLINSNDYNNLLPILEHGLKRPLLGSLYNICFNILPMFIILIIPLNKIKEIKSPKKTIIINHFISYLILFSIILFTLSNLGIYLTSLYQYPEYIILKRINIFNFINRIENFITLQWILGMFISLSFYFYYLIQNSNNKNNNKTKFKTFLYPTLSLILSLTLFKNNTIFNNLVYKYTIPIGTTIFILITIIFIKTKRKKN